MAFRKRNAAIPQGAKSPSSAQEADTSDGSLSKPALDYAPKLPPGTRASPADGRRTTSTGTPSLDALLAGHAGLPLGHSLVVEETGTTDYAGALLRCYAAQGIAQGHHVHVVGAGPPWVKELPGLVEGRGSRSEKPESQSKAEAERMKIAWRYEGLGVASQRQSLQSSIRSDQSQTGETASDSPFCHTFDLAKRLTLPQDAHIIHHQVDARSSKSPFESIIVSLRKATETAPDAIHRIVVPSILSPIFYPPHAAQPQYLLQFLHALRALFKGSAENTVALISLPLTLQPRASALTRWCEHLLDGVIELAPFPFRPDDYNQNRLSTSGAATKEEEKPQGMVKVHKLPVVHERGGGGIKGLGDDMAFTVSRRRFRIGPFSLPPEEGDTEAQKGAQVGDGEGGMPAKEKMDF